MDKNVKMKSGLLIAAVLGSFVSANAGLALEPTIFPGKGDRALWNKAGKVMNEGIILADQKKLDAAITKFEEAARIYPYSDCTYRNLGVTYEERAKSGDVHKAEAAYRKASELDPKDWRNWNALAGNMGAQERYKECRDASVKAMSCNPPAEKADGIKKTIKSLNDYLVTQK